MRTAISMPLSLQDVDSKALHERARSNRADGNLTSVPPQSEKRRWANYMPTKTGLSNSSYSIRGDDEAGITWLQTRDCPIDQSHEHRPSNPQYQIGCKNRPSYHHKDRCYLSQLIRQA